MRKSPLQPAWMQTAVFVLPWSDYAEISFPSIPRNSRNEVCDCNSVAKPCFLKRGIVKRFNVVVPKEDGGVEVYRMKEWLRQQPENIPAGLDGPSSTSHELRDGLKKMEWSVHSTLIHWWS